MKYNQLPYNRGSDDSRLLKSTCIMRDKIYVDYSKSVGLKSQAKLQEQLKFSIDAVRAVMRNFKAENSLEMQGNLFALIGYSEKFEDNLNTNQYASKYISNLAELVEDLKTESTSGKTMSISKKLKDGVSAETELSKLMIQHLNIFDSLLLSSSATTTETVVIILNGQLQQGEIIEIDSEFFTVTKDGINIFDRYNNEWVFLSRSLVDLAFSSTGEMDIEMIYKERYL